jgi:hypothetical protein
LPRAALLGAVKAVHMEREIPSLDELAPSSVEGATYELISNLARIFENQATPAGPAARLEYIRALRAIGIFLKNVRADPRVILKLFELGTALSDLDDASTDPLFRIERPGKPLDSTARWRARGSVALGMAALIETGKSQEEAAAAALRVNRDIASLAGAKSARSGNPKQTLTNWYTVFCGARCKNRIAQDMFEEGRALVVEIVSKVPARADVLAVQLFKNASAIGRRLQRS